MAQEGVVTEIGDDPTRDDALEWELHAAISALERIEANGVAWLRGIDDYYWMRLEGNRSGYLQLAAVLLRVASDRRSNAEYVKANGPNLDLARLFVPSSQLRLQLGARIEAAPPTGQVGARQLRAQLRHAATLWGLGCAIFLTFMVLVFVVLGALGMLTDR